MTIDSLPESEAAQAAAFETSLLDGTDSCGGALASQVGRTETIRLLNSLFTSGRTSQVNGSACLMVDAALAEKFADRYRLIRKLGSGSFGEVYLAEDQDHDREVAIKIPLARNGSDDEARKRLTRENDAASRLRHPNIVSVFEAGKQGDTPYIASEYCPGPNMADWLRERTENVEATVAATMVKALASAIEHSHQHGVLHRDIKPANILLEVSAEDPDGPLAPRLTDFGLAKNLSSHSNASSSGMFLGTLKYASPEQLRGESSQLTESSDIYSLGMILYEMVAGKRIAEHASQPRSRKRDSNVTHFELPSERDPSVPIALDRICSKCLRHLPGERYHSAAELENDLSKFLSSESSVPASGSQRLAPPPSAIRIVAIAVPVLVVILSLALFARKQAAVQDSKSSPVMTETPSQELAIELDAIAMRFDGIDDKLSVNSLVYRGNQAIRAEAWVKPHSARRMTILNLSGLLLIELHGLVPVAVASPAEEVYLRQFAENELPKDQWTHLAVAYDGQMISLFVNGVKQFGESRTLSWDPGEQTYVDKIGPLTRIDLNPLYHDVGFVVGDTSLRDSTSTEFCFEGSIAEVKISRDARDIQPRECTSRLTGDENTIALFRFDATAELQEGTLISDVTQQHRGVVHLGTKSPSRDDRL